MSVLPDAGYLTQFFLWGAGYLEAERARGGQCRHGQSRWQDGL